MRILLIRMIFTKVAQFIRFSIAGLISTGINYGTLYVFLAILSLEVVVSTTLAFVLSTATNFILQKYWAFGDRRLEVMSRQVVSYVAAALLMLGVNDGIWYVLADVVRANYLLTQVVATLAVSVVGVEATRRIFTPQPQLAAVQALNR